MTKEEKALLVMEQLKKEYPVVETPLIHSNVFELLIATMLSPQTPDNTTNKVTPVLFAQYATPYDLSGANFEDVSNIIRSINFHRTKAERIIIAADMVLNDFANEVPHKMEQLLQIPGVGRKVANVVISEWYAVSHPSKDKSDEYSSTPRGSILPEGFVVDTHVLRVSKMLGLTEHTDPQKVELDLMELFPRDEWNTMSLRFIFHGREINPAKNPTYHTHPFWSTMYSR